MDMKVVVLGIFVEDRPLFRVAQLHGHVGATFVENLVIDEEGRFLWVHRKCERAPVRDRTRSYRVNVQRSVYLLRADLYLGRRNMQAEENEARCFLHLSSLGVAKPDAHAPENVARPLHRAIHKRRITVQLIPTSEARESTYGDGGRKRWARWHHPMTRIRALLERPLRRNLLRRHHWPGTILCQSSSWC